MKHILGGKRYIRILLWETKLFARQIKSAIQSNLYSLITGMNSKASNFPENYFEAVLSTLTLCVIDNPAKVIEAFVEAMKPGGRIVLLDYTCSRNPEVRKWQELFQYHAQNVGFPKDVICWNSLADYDKILEGVKNRVQILEYERLEGPNPFLTLCKIVAAKS